MDNSDVLQRNAAGELEVRVVNGTEKADAPANYDDVFTVNSEGKRALRVVGAGGGGGTGTVTSVNGVQPVDGNVEITGDNITATVGEEEATITQHLTTLKNDESELGEQVQGLQQSINNKLNVAQGVDNYGKMMQVSSSGNLELATNPLGIHWDVVTPDTSSIGSLIAPVYRLGDLDLPDGRYKIYVSSATSADYGLPMVYAIYFTKNQNSFYGEIVYCGNELPNQGNLDSFFRIVSSSNAEVDGAYIGTKTSLADNGVYLYIEPSAIGHRVGGSVINDCFKASKLINLDTGEETSVEFSSYMNYGEQPPGSPSAIRLKLFYAETNKWDSSGNSNYMTKRPTVYIYNGTQDPVSHDEFSSIFTYRISINNNDDYVVFYVVVGEGVLTALCEKSTGIFSNLEWEMRFYGDAFEIYPKTELSEEQNFSASINFFGTKAGASFYLTDGPRLSEGNVYPVYKGDEPIQLAEMPTITALELGKIIQYIGTNTDDYKQGYFYKASGELVSSPESASISNITAYPSGEATSATVSVNLTALKNVLLNMGLEMQSLKVMTNNIEDQVLTPLIEYNGNLYYMSNEDDAGATVFTITPNGATGMIQFNVDYTPESETVQNESWVPVNVQPGLPDQTGNAGKFLTTDGTNASWGKIQTDATLTGSGTADSPLGIAATVPAQTGTFVLKCIDGTLTWVAETTEA